MNSGAPATGVAAQVWAALPAPDQDWLKALAALAPTGSTLALVGGAVRDALLGQATASPDLDIVLDSSETDWAQGSAVQRLAQATGLPFLFHPAFGNATLTWTPPGLPGTEARPVDLVQARRETYPLPGGNPVPQPGTLTDDLRRRDFGLNALALTLTPHGPGPLLDEVGGLDDLRARTLRPLHPRSLAEDASRLVRGARLAARLKLAAHPDLLAQVPDALKVADRTPRLWAELRLLLGEPRPGRAARMLHHWGAGGWLPPGSLELLEALDHMQDQGETVRPQTYAAALLAQAPAPSALAERLGLGDKPAALLTRALGDAPFAASSSERQLRGLLRPEAYPVLTGRDVVAAGVPPGKAVGVALHHLAVLRRTGRVRSAAEEQAALREYLAQLPESS